MALTVWCLDCFCCQLRTNNQIQTQTNAVEIDFEGEAAREQIENRCEMHNDELKIRRFIDEVAHSGDHLNSLHPVSHSCISICSRPMKIHIWLFWRWPTVDCHHSIVTGVWRGVNNLIETQLSIGAVESSSSSVICLSHYWRWQHTSTSDDQFQFHEPENLFRNRIDLAKIRCGNFGFELYFLQKKFVCVVVVGFMHFICYAEIALENIHWGKRAERRERKGTPVWSFAMLIKPTPLRIIAECRQWLNRSVECNQRWKRKREMSGNGNGNGSKPK